MVLAQKLRWQSGNCYYVNTLTQHQRGIIHSLLVCPLNKLHLTNLTFDPRLLLIRHNSETHLRARKDLLYGRSYPHAIAQRTGRGT